MQVINNDVWLYNTVEEPIHSLHNHTFHTKITIIIEVISQFQVSTFNEVYWFDQESNLSPLRPLEGVLL